MMETGPFRVDGNGGLKVVDGGWEEYTTMVFSSSSQSSYIPVLRLIKSSVDQPAGTGFSYTSTNRYVHELGEVCALYPGPSSYH